MSLVYIYHSARAGFHNAASNFAASAKPLKKTRLFCRSGSNFSESHNVRFQAAMPPTQRDPVKSATNRVNKLDLRGKPPSRPHAEPHDDSRSQQHSRPKEVDAKPAKAPASSAKKGWDGKTPILASEKGIKDLKVALASNNFFSKGEDYMMKMVRDAFVKEMELLKGIVPAEGGIDGNTEQQRTELGVKALYWIKVEDYASFVKGQKFVPLTLQSFREIHVLFNNVLGDNTKKPEAYLALIMSIFVNDLGKAITSNKAGQNHDVLLANAAEDDLIKCIGCLDTKTAAEVRRGITLGGELNIAQLQQAENVSRCLKILEDSKYKPAFKSRFLEQILDIAGAQAHACKPGTGCTPIVEPFWQGLKVAYKECVRLTEGTGTALKVYNTILSNRASVLKEAGHRHMYVEKPDDPKLKRQYLKDRALLRLFLMGRVTSKAAAEKWEAAMANLTEEVRSQLIQRLNVNGSSVEHAVIPYYMPAVFSEGLKTVPDTHPHPGGELEAMMKYLNIVLNVPELKKGHQGHVYERDLSEAKEFVKKAVFRRSPDDLLKITFPEVVVI